MTHFKIKDNWGNEAQKYGYGYQNKNGLQDRTRRRRMSKKDEKLLLSLIAHSRYLGNNDGVSEYEFRGIQ